MHPHDMLTMIEVAEELRKSYSTIRNHVRSGDLHSVRIGVRPLIPRSEIERVKSEGLPPTSRHKAVSI